MFPLSGHRDISFDAPQFTRLRHRYRGPRESEKVNLEVNQLYYSLRKLYEKYDTFQEDFVDRANTIFEGGETGVQDHLALELEGVNSHASIPDVNILNANTAHLEQSLGRWVIQFTPGTVVHSTDRAFFGSSSAKAVQSTDNERLIIATGAAGSTAAVTSSVVAGSPIAVSARLYAMTRVVPVEFWARWYNASNVFISNTSAAAGSTVVGQWGLHTGILTPPANAVKMDLEVRLDNTASTLMTGDTFYLDAVCVRAGSTPTFVPSHRITGNLDVRVKLRAESMAVIEWYPLALVNRAVFGVDSAGRMKAWAAETAEWDGLSSVFSTVPLPSPLSTQELRWVVVPDNGSGAWEVSFYYRTNPSEDWTQLGTTRVGPASSSFSIRNVGNVFRTGIFNPNPNYTSPSVHFYGEARDGINGPIVARFDVNSGWQDGDTAPASNFDAQGNEWTLHGGATVVAEIKHSMTEGLENLVKRLDVLKRRVKVLEA